MRPSHPACCELYEGLAQSLNKERHVLEAVVERHRRRAHDVGLAGVRDDAALLKLRLEVAHGADGARASKAAGRGKHTQGELAASASGVGGSDDGHTTAGRQRA